MIALGGVCAPQALAQTHPSQETSTQQSNTAVQGLQQASSNEEQAREWGLTSREFSRYQTLMQGPRGIYSPGLDPLTTLGIEARSAEERRRYAELQVQAERQRVDKELAYQRAYDEANARMFPGEKVIQISSPSAGLNGSKPALQGDGRLAIFVKDDCPPCIAKVRDLQAQRQAFDLYFVGSQGEDEHIRRWAILAGVEPKNVRSRQITLNHDQGRWMGLGLGGDLPAVVREVNGQWQRH
ncbi:TIGR03759 family integrating conjugative element protein [Pseudomonas lalucatii]|nr:TIGR03759 family integrating conjugative element protein [Pseudomonas lalucatii]